MSYVIYVRGHRPPDVYPRDHVVVFQDPSQAKVWLMKMEHNLPEGYTLKSAQIASIRAAPDTYWQLDDEHATWILRFKYGTWDEVHAKDEPEVTQAKRQPRSQRAAKAQRPDGYVSISDLCASSAVPASDARAILRASMEKPAYGWAFAPTEVKAIKKLVGIR